MFRDKIKQAYDKVKGDGYCYIEDVQKESGLQADIFLLCLKSLAGSEAIELQSGFEFWNDKKMGYEINDEKFYGMIWQSEYDDKPQKESTQKTAFERLFDRIAEISAVMECSGGKNNAVKIIKSEFPEFEDIPDNTIKQKITDFPFLCKVTSELDAIKQQLNIVKQAKDGCLKEIDVVKQELNITLNNLETTEQRLVKSNKDLASMKQQVIEKEKGMIELNNKLNSTMDNNKIAIFMQETEKQFVELNNRIKQLESDRQEVKQIKQVVKQKGLNNVGKWNVVESGGYYRAFRNIDGKNVGVYIGKEFDDDLVKEKIQAKGYPLD